VEGLASWFPLLGGQGGPQPHHGQKIHKFRQGACFTPFLGRQLSSTILAVEQFLKSMVKGRRQLKPSPILGQIQLNNNRHSHFLQQNRVRCWRRVTVWQGPFLMAEKCPPPLFLVSGPLMLGAK